MEYIDIRGTSQENIAKEVEEIAKRRGMQLDFQVSCYFITFDEALFLIRVTQILGHLAIP